MRSLYKLPITGDFISLSDVTGMHVSDQRGYDGKEQNWTVTVKIGGDFFRTIKCKSARHAASVRTQIFNAREKERAETAAQDRVTAQPAPACSRAEFWNILYRLHWLDGHKLEVKGVNDKNLHSFRSAGPMPAYLSADTETIDIVWPMISGEVKITNKEPL